MLAVTSIASEASAQGGFIWTGLYAGPNVGYSWGTRSDLYIDGATGAVLSGASDSSTMDGAVGGGQFGYDRQVGSWVFGWETDFQFTSQKSSSLAICA